MLNKLEIEEISKNKSTVGLNGYNVELGGNRSPISEETKKKISIANKGKKRDESWVNPTGKKVIDLTTGVIYKNTLIAEESLGLAHVRDVCLGLSKSSSGRVFRYIENEEIVQIKNNQVDIEVYKRILPKYQHLFLISDRKNQSKGKILHIESGRTFNSSREAAGFTGISYQSVLDVLNKKKSSVKGNSFLYIEEVMSDELC